MRRVHSFLSPTGFGITLLVFLSLGFSFWRDGGMMFSPGQLTAQNQMNETLGGFVSHEAFESQCERCHAPLEAVQADLCIQCHEKVMSQVSKQIGTHSVLLNFQECRVCHPDHRGRDFNPTAAAYGLFDHNLTRFSLIWHQFDYDTRLIDCLDCHADEDGFPLASEACQSCHSGNDPIYMEIHVQDFGGDCLVCHNGSGDLSQFDHNRTQFPLEGAHDQTRCTACHTEEQFLTLPVACESCHSEPDVHFGLFSQDCDTCHTAVDWSALTTLNGQVFDHFDQFGFSLDRHQVDYSQALIRCSACHSRVDGFKVGFDLAYCIDCHQAESPLFTMEHQALFGSGCLTCHDGVDRMSDFSHEQIFPLDGQHAVIACESCHTNQTFHGTPSNCVDCHQEPAIHAGYFGIACQNCHGTDAWWPARMLEHNFPLDHGDQGLIACEVCHSGPYTDYNCYGCHEHQQEDVLEEHLEEGISSSELANCVDCHPDGLEHDD